MPGVLDDLLSGAATVGKTALQVPQAVGGGALDILIGDRTNVPAGEQLKRSIEALLLSGDNPANLIAIHRQNAARDDYNAQVVNTPEFRRTMSVMETTKSLTPEQAYDATAKLYGVTGYRPPMEAEAIDAPLSAADAAAGLDAPSLPDRQNVPQLPPLGSTALTKDLVARTQYDAMTRGSVLDQLLARYQASGLNPPMNVQKAAAEDALAGYDKGPGITTREAKWNGERFTITLQDLKPDEQFFAGEDAENRALKAAYYQNKYRESIGDPVRVGLAASPSGALTLVEMQNPAGTAAAGVRGKAEGENTPLGGGPLDPAARGKTPAQLEDERKRATAVQTAVLKTVSGQITEANKLADTASFLDTQLKPLEAFIPSLPDKAYAGPAGAATSAYRKVSNWFGTKLELDSAQVPLAIKSTARLVVANIGRSFGEKGVFTDKDRDNFLSVLDISDSSQASGATKLATARGLYAELQQRAADKAAGRPVTLPEGSRILSPQEIADTLNQASDAAGSGAGRPSTRATPQAPANTIQTKSGRTIVYEE